MHGMIILLLAGWGASEDPSGTSWGESDKHEPPSSSSSQPTTAPSESTWPSEKVRHSFLNFVENQSITNKIFSVQSSITKLTVNIQTLLSPCFKQEEQPTEAISEVSQWKSNSEEPPNTGQYDTSTTSKPGGQFDVAAHKRPAYTQAFSNSLSSILTSTEFAQSTSSSSFGFGFSQTPSSK